MISRREAFLILAIALGSVSTFQCPTNQMCTCQQNYDGGLEINCLLKNDSSFLVNIQPGEFIKIECINSPEWSDFHLDVSSLTRHESIKKIYFYMCDLPTNNISLGEITRTLGVANVEKLIFQSYKNLSSALVKHHLDDFENLKYLVLSSNNVSYVDEDLLAGLVNLTGLNLRENNLHLVDGFFNYTPGLEWLELGDNALRSIELGTFNNLKNLTLLNLWKNYLIDPQSGIFDELVALKTLDLNMNSMVQLPEDIFAKLENLEVLNLSRNNFTHLPGALLRNNTKLHTVSLFENKRNMTTLPNEFFANLTKLEVLKLKKNGFLTLPEDIFWGCTSLTNITLERNYLRTLPAHIFRDTKKLTELNLNFNNIEHLPDYIFSSTNELVKLDLSKNQITFISNHLFIGLHALEELNMEENQLTTISNHAFSSLKQLKIAQLSHNYLTLQQTVYESDPLGKKSPFHDCVKLEELYLANNSISEMFSDWVLSDVQLRILDLKYNNISCIATEDVQFTSDKIKVDLTHNKIKHILLHNAESNVFQGYARDVIILVQDNPILCDCDLYDFLRYKEGRMHPKVQNYFHIIPGNLTCESPDDEKDVRVTDLRSESLTCVVPDSNVCSEKCDCLIRPEDRAFILNCSNRNLISVPSDIKIPDKYKIPFQFELNFSGNRLTRMPDLKAMELGPVRKLMLSHNAISEISLDGLSSTLQVLELHNNNVSRVRPDVLEFLKESTNLTRLTLHENPWECDCDATDLLNFIQTNFVTMPDLLRVKCPDRNISISELTRDDLCPPNTTMIIGVSILISFAGLLIGIFGLLYYKYQQQIKVWLFAHQWCLWFVTEEELDKEKLYDAFVSYSHKDHDFVVNELVSKLENGPMPFKLCLHYRDWLAGEWIPANIASSVENSRRTIVVLSPDFMESVWGRMEFRAAHSQALSEGRARVILIMYGDIGPIDDLDPELKAYISMNTYVKWGDPWFWDKLRYALPHQPNLARHSIAGKKIFENHQLYIPTDGNKKELYPITLPETPASTTPPADALKKFICDKESEEQFLNGYPRESCKLNGNIAIILSPELLMKHNNRECLA
ncbi:PREDICTED: protein toll-like [Vollenhovia emeryi]|uniref:protein toll-like n=1 Tax=Vollenhovia emeryi TaxID=411798 RepID=UPI0005F3CD80|nr:PREDICTED: protein toll-like [Vollenhovia emeryi]